MVDVRPIAEALERAGQRGTPMLGTTPADIAELVGHSPAVGLARRDVLTAFGVRRVRKRTLASADSYGGLVAEPMSLLVYDRCLVTVRHAPLLWVGRKVDEALWEKLEGGIAEADKRPLEDLVTRTSGRWVESGGRTTADLAQLVLGELTASLDPGVESLSRALEFGEHAYFEVLEADELVEADLTAAQRSLFELARLIAEFGRAAYFFGAWTPDDPSEWFTGASATREIERVQRRHEQVVDRIRALRQDLRASVDMMASTVASRQLVIAHRQEERTRQQLLLAEQQRERNERFMRDATIVASVVLLPTLIATIYGANIALPFQHRFAGSVLLLAAMAIGAGLAWLVLRRRVAGHGEPDAQQQP